MPRFIVTPEMGIALKNLRIQKNVKAIDVAKSISKTGAYISKLEKGVLNTIDENVLVNIIRNLSNSEEEFNENIKLLLTDSVLKYSKKEAENKEWRLNLDLFYRKIKVPESYHNLVKNKLNVLNVSISELTTYINSNSDLYQDEHFSNELLDQAEKNHWYFNNGDSFIVMHIEEETLEKVIFSNEISANYSILFCILMSLLRFEKLSHDDAYREAKKLLSDLKIQTLSDKEALMDSYDKLDEIHSILDQRNNTALPEEDLELLTTLYNFTNKINSFAQIQSVEYVNKKLSVMLDNLSTDPITFMGYIGVDLSKLKDCDFQIKKDFVAAIKDLIEEYSIRKPTKSELI